MRVFTLETTGEVRYELLAQYGEYAEMLRLDTRIRTIVRFEDLTEVMDQPCNGIVGSEESGYTKCGSTEYEPWTIAGTTVKVCTQCGKFKIKDKA